MSSPVVDEERTPGPRRHGPRAGLLVLGLAGVVLAACGTAGDATEGSQATFAAPEVGDPTQQATPRGTSVTTTADEPAARFSWSLPGGDLSVDAIGDVFNTLRAGRCQEASDDLEVFLVNDPVWTAGQEQLYRAAVAACSRDTSTARVHLDGASLTTHPGDCRLFKAVVSSVDQRAQDDVRCPAPEPRPSLSDASSETAGGDPVTTSTEVESTSAGEDVSPSQASQP